MYTALYRRLLRLVHIPLRASPETFPRLALSSRLVRRDEEQSCRRPHLDGSLTVETKIYHHKIKTEVKTKQINFACLKHTNSVPLVKVPTRIGLLQTFINLNLKTKS